MDIVWTIYFWALPLWTFLFIPFSTFYYEADDGLLLNPDGPKKSKLLQAICWTLGTVIVVGLIFFVTYLLFSDSSIPVQTYTAVPLSQSSPANTIYTSIPDVNGFQTGLLEDLDPGTATSYWATVKNNGEETITLKVGISTFFAALMAWLGWFLFAIFGGIGMSALPLDLIYAYKNRPRRMEAAEYAEAQMSLRERVNELVNIGELLKVERDGKSPAQRSKNPFNKDNRKEREAMNSFKSAVFLLEKDVEDFQACSNNSSNPLIPYFCLVGGILSFVITLLWLFHICVYVLPNEPIVPFLNTYFMWFDNWFPLFGVFSVAIFTIYMMFAAVKGCFKFGLRCACIQLHPMKVGKTYMSSMLFNCGLVLLCALPVVQFCATSFSTYARNSTIYQIFGVQVQNLDFFGWWWTKRIFTGIFLGWSVLCALYLICRPKDGPSSPEELKERLRSRNG